MMIHPFDEVYLNKAENTLGSMLDYAVYSLHIGTQEFMELFIASGAASLFESGDIRIIAGTSGVELAYYVMEQSGLSYERVRPRFTSSLSKEYMGGSILAHLQWQTGISFAELLKKILPIEDIINLYDTHLRELQRELLEAWPPVMDANSPEKKAERQSAATEFVMSQLTGKLQSGNTDTRLKTLRLKNGLSQSKLAKSSGVPVRTIQQYEQRQKDINKAQFAYLVQLSKALACDPVDLLER